MPKVDLDAEGMLRRILQRHTGTPENAVGSVEECSKGVYLVAYMDRNPSWVFVPDPIKRGRFCRVPRGFLYYGCPACGALPGQPCHNPKHGTSWSGMTGHADRGSSSGRNYPVFSHKTHDADVLQEAALVALARQVQLPGVSLTVEHLRNCLAYNDKRSAKKMRLRFGRTQKDDGAHPALSPEE